jgi:hypothetical protein
MTTWNNEVINSIKQGSIKTVILFGDDMNRVATPYVVVKPIMGGDRKLYQIIVHMETGTQDILETYVFRELPALLKEPLTADGKQITVHDTKAGMGSYVDEGDNTLAMSRDFFIPVIL